MVAEILKERDSKEYYLVKATGVNYCNMSELQVMNYREAMAKVNHEKWEKVIKLEHKKMVKHNVFQVVKKEQVPKETKLINFTWAMKKKSKGVYRARLAIRISQQKKSLQYQADNKSAPGTNGMTIKIVLTLIVLGNWFTKIVNIKGAFIYGNFQ